MNSAVPRLLAKVIVTEAGCWEFTGSCDRKGYGRFHYEGRTEKAHRAAWMIYRGPLAPGTVLLHVVCDNPPCCNPWHTRPGTVAENNLDMAAKGRVRNGHTVLSPSDVAEVRRLYAEGGWSQRRLGAKFGVSQQAVSNFVTGARRTP